MTDATIKKKAKQAIRKIVSGARELAELEGKQNMKKRNSRKRSAS